jgi:hypothetical protein
MTSVESKKDLIGLLLILRSVCAQNKGSVKVDEEYQNLNALHQAIGYRQNNTVNNTTYREERYLIDMNRQYLPVVNFHSVDRYMIPF